MANDTTNQLWVLDSVGIITQSPVCVRKIVLIPNAANDVGQINVYSPSSPEAAGSLTGKTGTITLTNTLTSAGNLPSSIGDGDVFEIIDTSGAAGNKGKKLVKTAGTGDAVVITEDNWTNEASVVYSWNTYPAHMEFYIKAGATDASPCQLDFGIDGRWFPNMILETLSTSARLHVYVR
jgi:hypothetical protein